MSRSITLVVPVYNEEASILPFLERVETVFSEIGQGVQFGILFVNDGSRDATERLILEAAAKQ
ncbi:MAG: glycosyltransferase, partial [Deltaproteobacteria bacterium]